MSEYAPEYTKKERFIILAKHLTWAIPLFSATQFWFLPWFRGYAENSHCYAYGYFTGTHVVFYFIFVVIPIGAALAFFAVEGARSLKIIRVGQNPLPGEKVFRKTKFKYGVKAKIQPFIVLCVLLFLVALGVQGIFWANEIIYNPNNNLPSCSHH